jgi:molybdenum cofactor synthesis domain-containing protein
MTGEPPAEPGTAGPEAAVHGVAGHGVAGHGAAGNGGDGPAEIRALAVTASNRAAAGVYPDRSGPVLVRLLAEAGCTVDGPLVVPDGPPVEVALREAITAGYHVVVTTGGTGLTPGDLTPEMTRRVLDREIPGIADAIRAAGVAGGVPAAMLSRGVAGLANGVLIVNLAGSTGGVRDGMAVLAPVLRHAVDQAHGGDHPRPGAAG